MEEKEQKRTYPFLYPKILGKAFWLWWDNLSRLVLISFFSYLVNIPFLFVIFTLYSRVLFTAQPVDLVWAVIILLTVAGFSMFFPLITPIYWIVKKFEEGEYKKFFSDYWEGLKKLFWKSLALSTITALIWGLGSYAIFFYIQVRFLPEVLRWSLAIFSFWFLLTYTFMLIYLYPVMVYFPEESVFSWYKRAFLLYADNTFTTIAVWLTLIPIFIIAFVFIPVMPFMYGGFVSCLFISTYKVILRKYRPELAKEEEEKEKKRSIMDIFQPWKHWEE